MSGPHGRDASSGWTAPVGLIVLSAVPLTAGALRLIQLTGGPALIPADDRFAGFPAALIVHIVGAGLYALVGAFQFVPRLRSADRSWHRRTGRVLVVAGLLVAGSALWMTLFYAPQPGTGELLFAFRLVFATSMIVSLVLGFTAIRRHHVASHRAWMIRAYAVGLGAGTQAFTEGVATGMFGTGHTTGDLAKGAGWIINLAIAEWVIRRPTRRIRHPRPGREAPLGLPLTTEHWSGASS